MSRSWSEVAWGCLEAVQDFPGVAWARGLSWTCLGAGGGLRVGCPGVQGLSELCQKLFRSCPAVLDSSGNLKEGFPKLLEIKFLVEAAQKLPSQSLSRNWQGARLGRLRAVIIFPTP